MPIQSSMKFLGVFYTTSLGVKEGSILGKVNILSL